MSSEDRYYVINGTLIHSDDYDEMCHAGVKGMHWGKHLPGTDWWKTTTGNISRGINKLKGEFQRGLTTYDNEKRRAGMGYNARTKVGNNTYERSNYFKSKNAYNENYSKKGRAKAYATVAGRMISRRVSKLWNSSKGYTKDQINKFKDSARKAYAGARDLVHKYFESGNANYRSSNIEKSTSLSHLEQLIKKEQREAASAYVTSKVKGGAGNTINSLIQSSQMRVVSGVNQFLKNIGMDDEVDKFLSKFMGNSSKITGQNNKERSQANKTNSGYNRSERNMQSVSSLPLKKIKGSTKSARTRGYGTRI